MIVNTMSLTRREVWLYQKRNKSELKATEFSFSIALPAHSGHRPPMQFRNHFSHAVGHLGRVISPSQGRYLNKGQHKQNKHINTPNIHALSGIRTHDPSVQANEDSSCLRPRGYCDRPADVFRTNKLREN
jgi:hypothetical protein